jgi:UDP-N-acetylmuramate dehydrogenase
MKIEENIPLAPLTTFQIGGPARFFARAESLEDLKEATDFARNESLDFIILGGGSNVLVDDAGFNGLVILNATKGVEWTDKGEIVEVVAASGESWDKLVEAAVAKGLWGIENLSGIPGTVGGGVVQNIGAYGGVLSQTLVSVDVFDTQEKKIKTLPKLELQFGYRSSIFKQEEGRYVVLRAVFELSKKGAPNLEYKDLQAKFAGKNPSLEDVRSAVMDIRRNKFPDLSVEGTAGSFFKNPILPESEAHALQARFADMPLFSLPESTDIKVPLGWILDHVLNLRGFAIKDARVFERQALVIAAKRGCSSSDVKKLAEIIAQKVFDTCGITIEPEVKIL